VTCMSSRTLTVSSMMSSTTSLPTSYCEKGGCRGIPDTFTRKKTTQAMVLSGKEPTSSGNCARSGAFFIAGLGRAESLRGKPNIKLYDKLAASDLYATRKAVLKSDRGTLEYTKLTSMFVISIRFPRVRALAIETLPTCHWSRFTSSYPKRSQIVPDRTMDANRHAYSNRTGTHPRIRDRDDIFVSSLAVLQC
jgi:hypothetical protein